MAASSTRQGQLKQQISDLILGDGDLLKSISDAVSSLIVERLTSDDGIVEKISNKLSNQKDFVSTVTSKLENQKDSLKQELYQSLSFDSNELKSKLKELEKKKEDLESKNKDLEWEIDSLEQYSRRNCLLIHGIPESPRETSENVEAAALDIIREKVGIEIDRSDLDRSHRLSKRGSNGFNPAPNKPRPVIVKFISYNIRSEVFRKKRNLKGSGLGVTESLTKHRMELYSTVQSHPNTDSTWTLDGRIIALRTDNQRKVVINSPKDIQKLV